MIGRNFAANIKPLSAFRYFLNNKKRAFSMALAVAVSILLLMVFQMIFYSVTESARLAISGRLDQMTVVYPGDKGVVGESVLKKIKECQNTEKIVPMLVSNTDYYHAFGNLNIPIYFISNKNLNFVIDRLGLELAEGRLPELGKKEVLLDERTLKNKGKQLGDYIGREVDTNEGLPGKYEIVGVLKGECLVGVGVIDDGTLLEKNGFLLFPKVGRLEVLNTAISGINIDDADIITKEYGQSSFKEDQELMDQVTTIIVAVVIFIMSFAAANSSYAQYFSRRYEFGTLLSIGYSRVKILLRAAWEILHTNIVGLLLGIILVFLAKLGVKVLIFDPKGYPFLLFQLEGLWQAFIIPLCTVVASLIPAWWTLSRVDQVEIIEKFE